MLQSLIPLGLVLIIGLSVPAWRRDKAYRGYLMVAAYLCVLGQYMYWRLVVTVLPASASDVGGLVVWTVFAAEALLWAESTLIAIVLCRRTDRSAEADVYEAEIVLQNARSLPSVDVFITTYNEPLDVLEKTIAGAIALDWPKERLNVFVLDDGRRDWLKQHCEARHVNYMTRADNKHAKAGNINAAISQTNAPFFLVLDADFVPQTRMLRRAMGFFNDPKIGIVQMPHHFFNSDPIQTNLNMRSQLPDEQRFFFDVIQPGRDGWDCAFCCGSNGIVRREAIDSIGGSMPTDSVTEDMLLTLTLLRKGFITRYLGERLAIGLAPENLDAYFLQRGRWAQGAIQILYLKSGPLGAGLRLMQRLLFIPSHWLSQSICQPIAMITPAFFLLTGIPPLVNATLDQILMFQAPAVASGIIVMRFFAPSQFFPISSTVQSVMQAFRIMPIVILTFLRPSGHSFKVTPKGSDAGLPIEDRFIIKLSLLIIFLTGLGLFLNANFETRIVTKSYMLPVVTFWAIVNMIILLMVITTAVPRPIPRTQERFQLSESCRIHHQSGDFIGTADDMSLTGARISVAEDFDAQDLHRSGWIGIELPNLTIIPALIVRLIAEESDSPKLGVSFDIPAGPNRDRLIQMLFTQDLSPSIDTPNDRGVAFTMISRIFFQSKHAGSASVRTELPKNVEGVPDWLASLMATHSQNVTRDFCGNRITVSNGPLNNEIAA